MALEHYKTQVLLLHNEQSTLDALGATFNGRYAVHFATTGSEALTTLGETPIHIIVSAQDLPGMSGLEALREAKKRSPDTIGILLTGEHGKEDVEALVGEQEVFQIVRGAVQPDVLMQIVENAARRVRMMAISESANDNEAARPVEDHSRKAANPADGGEHIIMETMENGAAMITDATGSQPVLNPQLPRVKSTANERSVDVLVLSKDEDFINTIRACARGLHTVHHAVTARQAQQTVAAHKVGVLVTDAAIAGNKVALLTQKLREHAPRLVAVVAGRRDDGESLMELINQGQVYRFLLKPVSPGRARLAVEACVKYHLDAPDSVFGHDEAVVAAPQATPAAAPPPPRAEERRPVATEQPAVKAESTVDPLARTDTFRVPDIAPPSLDSAELGDRLQLPVIPATVAAIMLAAVGGWYFLAGPGSGDSVPSRQDTPASQEAAVTTPVASPAAPPAAIKPAASTNNGGDEYLALLDNARFARDSGRLLTPAGDNALEWYIEARTVAPDNVIVRDELAALVDQLLGMAETAMLENRIVDVDAVLSMVTLADPDNTRLAFLSAQRNQQILRAALDDARAAVRGGRYDAAASLLADASRLPGADQNLIQEISDDLNAARRAQRVDDVLALANARLASGQLMGPASDNAGYFFKLAASNDPGNVAAQQGLEVVVNRLVLNARAAIDAGNYDAAAQLLDGARALEAGGAEFVATEQALEKSLQLQAEATRRAAAARQSANQQLGATEAAGPRRRAASTATLTNDSGSPAAEDSTAAATAPPAASATINSSSDAQTEMTGAAIAAGPAAGSEVSNDEPPAVLATQARPLEQVPISQLTRRNYVAPQYPRHARRRDLSGWVDIAFTVQRDGGVGDIEILDSMPGKVFAEAATDAVEQWRFEPVIEDGSPVAKRVAVRLSFALQ